MNTKAGAMRAILSAWLLAGSLDLTAACIQYYLKTGRSPIIIPRYISSALFGKDALAGGKTMVLAGTALHYFIAFCFTLFFFFIYPRFKFLSKNLFLTGMVYGLFAWAVMNLLVLPMTRLELPAHFDPVKNIIPALIIMFCIGLPIALVIGRYYRLQKTSNRLV